MKNYIQNYPGCKAVSGWKQQFFNILPKANYYFDMMAGSGYVGRQIQNHLRDIGIVFFNEASAKVATELEYLSIETLSAMELSINSYSQAFHIYSKQLKCTNNIGVFYFDPPYLFDSRKSKLPIYDTEWFVQDHRGFLEFLKENFPVHLDELDCCIVSHYPCEMYDQLLTHGWRKREFQVMTRGGVATEALYFNFDPKDHELLTYDYLGENNLTRQRIKRYQKNMIKRIDNLSLHEKYAMLQLINDKFSIKN